MLMRFDSTISCLLLVSVVASLVVVLCASSCLARSDSAPSSTQGVMWQFDYDEGPGDWEGDDYATVGRDSRYHLNGIGKGSDLEAYASEYSFDDFVMELTLTAERFRRDGVIGVRVRADADSFYEFQIRRGATMSSISMAIVKGGSECVELATTQTDLTSMDIAYAKITVAVKGDTLSFCYGDELLLTAVDNELSGGMVGLHVNENALAVVDSIRVTPATVDIKEADMHRLSGLLDGAGTTNLPEPSWDSLPEWRGFNLLFMLDRGDSYGSHFYPPLEEEYAMISELGFNFVRLPLDYRIWTQPWDWELIDGEKLQWLDQAIIYARKHNIHVMICLHKAPGHMDGRPDLITDAESLRVCALHWAHLARRYKGIPSKELSFNLFNEPRWNVTDEQYMHVVNTLAEAIWNEDPDRLIVADGLDVAARPVAAMKDLGMPMAGRGYEPVNVSHYGASWHPDSPLYPMPSWPQAYLPGILYGPIKRSMGVTGPWTIEFEEPLESDYRFGIKIREVSDSIRLVVKADDQVVLDWSVDCTDGGGEWESYVYEERYDSYRNLFDKFYYAALPRGTQKVTVEAVRGDWVSFYEVVMAPESGGGTAFTIPVAPYVWGQRIGDVRLDSSGEVTPVDRRYWHDIEWLRTQVYGDWKAFVDSGGAVMIGEFGGSLKAPHDVVLRWMDDLLTVFNELGFPWALWGLRGENGILDTERPDAEYIDFHGHKLDVRMYEILKRH